MARKEGKRSEILKSLVEYLDGLKEDGTFYIDGELYRIGDRIRVKVEATGSAKGAGLVLYLEGTAEGYRRPLISVILGSERDKPVADKVTDTLKQLGMGHEVVVLSAHRSPEELVKYIRVAEHRGIRVFICIAGMAAHLPGVVAAQTRHVVIGVPVASGYPGGQDALLSIVQMPPGVPVATVGVDAGTNAALLAARILQFDSSSIEQALEQFSETQRRRVIEKTPWLESYLEEALEKTDLNRVPLWKRGKVRDIYDLGDRLLIVATDRISVFDVVLPTPIPGKGKILTALSSFWFWKLKHVIPHHLVSTSLYDLPGDLADHYPYLEGRMMLIRKMEVFPIECIARGYLSGSGWDEYKETGKIKDVKLPSGLRESDRLPEPIFTPTSKAESGHDQPLSFEAMGHIVGNDVAEILRSKTLELYHLAAEYAEARGIIIADTKFEFGRDQDGRIYLVDEVLTPDSSRFWPLEEYKPGSPQPSFDKQYVRDYTQSLHWNKQPPGPPLPPDVVARTVAKYQEAYRRLVPV